MRRKPRSADPKTLFLREERSLNLRPARVRDPLFVDQKFFDPKDLVQVKYEMVRRVDVDHQPVSRVAAAFGFSRPAFYEARRALGRMGLVGLIPKKRGPHGNHKLTPEVVEFLENLIGSGKQFRSSDLAERLFERFAKKVHPRSIERVLAARKKKQRQNRS